MLGLVVRGLVDVVSTQSKKKKKLDNDLHILILFQDINVNNILYLNILQSNTDNNFVILNHKQVVCHNL